MSDYSVTNYNPNNINDTLYAYQSNRTVATNPIQQVPKTNYASSVSLETPPDTFELSAESRIRSKSEKKGMSTGLKALLWIGGTAAAVYGAVVGHRALTKPSIEKVAKNFSEIFRKDMSAGDAQNLIEKYKDIFKEKDKDKFIQRCFEQAKKDFGYEKLSIKIDKIPQAEIDKAAKEGFKLDGGYRPLGVNWGKTDGKITEMHLNDTVIQVNPNWSKQEIFRSIIHELTHAKQHEMAYRLDKKAFYDALKEARFSLSKDKSYYEEITNEYIKEFERVYGDVWNRLPKIEKGSKEYELAQKYLEDIKHYIGGGKDTHDKYMEQIVEQEAHGTAPLVDEIYKHFANIWRIPFFQ